MKKTAIDAVMSSIFAWFAKYKRVYVNADYPNLKTNITESGSHESSAQLNEAAEQDYWRFREITAENKQ